MPIEENRNIVLRYYEDLWNGWQVDLIDELIAPDIAFRGSLGLVARGRDAFRAYVATVRAAFPDFHNTVEELIVEGAKVAARLTYQGTHEGPVFEIAPTHRRVTYSGIALFRIASGQIADGYVMGDTLSLLRQLGAAGAGAEMRPGQRAGA
jgi:steroid delta-isomerase-like uncharacterized protein